MAHPRRAKPARIFPLHRHFGPALSRNRARVDGGIPKGQRAALCALIDAAYALMAEAEAHYPDIASFDIHLGTNPDWPVMIVGRTAKADRTGRRG